MRLKCLNRFIGVMLDRFGSNLRLLPADHDHFYLDVDVVVSPQFFFMGVQSGRRCTHCKPTGGLRSV